LEEHAAPGGCVDLTLRKGEREEGRDQEESEEPLLGHCGWGQQGETGEGEKQRAGVRRMESGAVGFK